MVGTEKRDVGRFVQSLHESHGITFRLGATLARTGGMELRLTS
jgi:hypothetical protein